MTIGRITNHGLIDNPGVFPPEITPETIKNPHDSYPYNPKIAEALYRATWLENWVTGAKRIIDACREQGVESQICFSLEMVDLSFGSYDNLRLW